MSWDDVARTFETDKSSCGPKGDLGHNYMPYYEAELGPRAEKLQRVLEIGVASGGSLRMWEQLFPAANIVGLDISPPCKTLAGGRVIVETANAADPDESVPVAMAYGPFDLIIDDGSHRESDVFPALDVFFGALVSGGIYVIEDMYCEWFDDRTKHTRKELARALRIWPGFCGRLVEWVLRRPTVERLRIYPCGLTIGKSQEGQCIAFLEKS